MYFSAWVSDSLEVNWHGVSVRLDDSVCLLCRRVQLEPYLIWPRPRGAVSFSGIDWDGKVAGSTLDRFLFHTYRIAIFQDTRAWVAGIMI